jgi:glycosyltransferase involved in cell wall biosynthesis
MARCERCPATPGSVCQGEADHALCFLRRLRDPRPAPAPAPRPTGPVAPPGSVRVGLVSPCLHHGGAEYWMLTLVRALAGSFAFPGLAVTGGRACWTPGAEAPFGGYLTVGWGPDAARDLARRSDVLLEWAVSGLPGLLGPGPVPPVVAVSHSTADSSHARSVYADPAGISRFVAVSELALGPVPPSHRRRAAVVWNAVDPARLEVRRTRAAVRASWGVPAGAPVCLYLGRYSPEKDPHAAARLAASLPAPWHVVAHGEGVLWEPLRAAAAVLPRLRVLPPDPAAGDLIAAADALLVPSLYESFCLSLAEALWLGVPVVATPVGLSKLVPGLSRPVPVGADGHALAAAVLADAADRDGTAARITRARAFARDRLAPDRFAREWAAVLREVAGVPGADG